MLSNMECGGDCGFNSTGQEQADYVCKLAAYATAVHERTVAYLATLSADDLDRVVDERWDPPVTLAVRLVSVVDDDAQHVGQAAYVRGLLGA